MIINKILNTNMKSFKILKSFKKPNIKSKFTKPFIQSMKMSTFRSPMYGSWGILGFSFLIGGGVSLLCDKFKNFTIKDENVNLQEELYDAINSNDYEKVKSLLENKKVDVNAMYKKVTMLHVALRKCNSNYAMIKLLLKNGANPHEIVLVNSNQYCSILVDAVTNCSDQIIKLLLKYDIYPNDGFSYRNKTLDAAISNNRLSTVKLLVDYGVNVSNSNIYDLVRKCIDNLNCEIAEYFLNRITIDDSINKKDDDMRNLLHIVIMEDGDLEKKKQMIKLLIDKGVDINAKTAFGNTPTSLAVKKYGCKNANESHNLVKFLVESGAKITFNDFQYFYSTYDTLKFLFDNVDEKTRNDYANELLYINFNYWCMNDNDLEIIKICIKYGGNVEKSLMKVDCKENIPKIREWMNKNNVCGSNKNWLWYN